MIVRVMEEDQYRLDDAEGAQFEQLDQSLLTAVQSDDQVAFMSALNAMLAFVRQHGDKVGYDEIIPSDVVVPAEDMTLQEARALLVAADTEGATEASPEGNSENAE
jgi:uncharacterized membrane protein